MYYQERKMSGIWCPLGFHLEEVPESYLKLLCLYKSFLSDITYVSIFGIIGESLGVEKAIASKSVHSFRD